MQIMGNAFVTGYDINSYVVTLIADASVEE